MFRNPGARIKWTQGLITRDDDVTQIDKFKFDPNAYKHSQKLTMKEKETLEKSIVIERMKTQRAHEKKYYRSKINPITKQREPSCIPHDQNYNPCPECGMMIHFIGNPCSRNPSTAKQKAMTAHLEADPGLKAYLSA